MSRPCLLALLLACTACGPSLEDHIEQLSGNPEERKNAQHELLLAKEQAVEPLLGALEDPRYAAGRAELADVLVSLMLRVEDPRIGAALQQQVLNDPDARVRARIASKLATHKNAKFIEVFFQALQDTSGPVRHQAMKALSLLENQLDETVKERLLQQARTMLEDTHKDARIEAMFVVEDRVAQLVKKAGEQAIKADLEGADSLFTAALAFSPTSH